MLEPTRNKLVTSPLDPMPAATPEIAAGWLARIRCGVLIQLITVPIGFSWALLATFHGGANYYFLVFSPTVFLVIVAAIWLTTSGEPLNPQWQLYARWGARAGILAWPVTHIVRLAAWGILPWRLGMTEALGQAYAALMLVGWVGVAAESWYGLNLAKRLRDRALTINLRIVVWLVGIFSVLAAIAFVADPAKGVEAFAKGLNHPPDGGTFYKTFSARIKWVAGCYGDSRGDCDRPRTSCAAKHQKAQEVGLAG